MLFAGELFSCLVIGLSILLNVITLSCRLHEVAHIMFRLWYSYAPVTYILRSFKDA